MSLIKANKEDLQYLHLSERNPREMFSGDDEDFPEADGTRTPDCHFWAHHSKDEQNEFYYDGDITGKSFKSGSSVYPEHEKFKDMSLKEQVEFRRRSQ